MTLHPAEQRYREVMARATGELAEARAERRAAIRQELRTKTTRQVAAEFGISFQRVYQILR